MNKTTLFRDLEIPEELLYSDRYLDFKRKNLEIINEFDDNIKKLAEEIKDSGAPCTRESFERYVENKYGQNLLILLQKRREDYLISDFLEVNNILKGE